MSARELGDWLDTPESKSLGWRHESDAESVGHHSAAASSKSCKAAVEPGSLVRSDGLKSYGFLPEYGYVHVPSFHKEAAPDDLAPLTHRVASLLKRGRLDAGAEPENARRRRRRSRFVPVFFLG